MFDSGFNVASFHDVINISKPFLLQDQGDKCSLCSKRPNEFSPNDRIKLSQTTEQNRHKQPKKHQKICIIQ